MRSSNVDGSGTAEGVFPPGTGIGSPLKPSALGDKSEKLVTWPPNGEADCINALIADEDGSLKVCPSGSPEASLAAIVTRPGLPVAPPMIRAI